MGNNQDTVRTLYDAFGRGDVPAVLAMMDDQIKWQEPDSMPAPFANQVGPQAIAENIFAGLAAHLKDFRVTVDDIVGDQDMVCAIGDYHGIGAATGIELDTPFAHVWRFGTGGKVTGFRTITDAHQWRRALGAD